MEALGEMIPNENTYCEIDPSVVDEWGIPVLRFHWRAGENELKMAKDMQQTFRAIVEAGAALTRPTSVPTAQPLTASMTVARRFTNQAQCVWVTIPRARP
jgi:hypothetical protein